MADTGPGNGRTDTGELMGKLLRTANIKRFLEKNVHSMEIIPFHEYIRQKCNERGAVPEQVIKRSNIERTYGHQLFRGLRAPSRDKVIQLAFGFGFGVEETQELLTAARKALLYPKIKRDAAILFCIKRGMDVIEAQSILEDLGISLLGEGDQSAKE
jgi:hypothetical protein